MRTVVNDKDITELVRSLKWSGDLKQIARKVSVSYIYDPDLAAVTIQDGDTLAVYDDDGKLRFVGIVISVESSTSDPYVSLDCVNVIWYTGKNKTYKVYKGTPQDVTKAVCGEFNIQTGVLPELEKQVEVVSTGDKTIYQVIAEAYGAEYYIYASGASLCVENKGSEVVAVLSTDANAAGIRYKSSIEAMVNRVMILDDKAALLGSVQNEQDFVYGLMQETYKKEDNKDPVEAAKALLKGKEKTSTVSVPFGDWNCTAGKAVYILDNANNMCGKFLILDDSHTVSGGQHSMELGVEVMGNGTI